MKGNTWLITLLTWLLHFLTDHRAGRSTGPLEVLPREGSSPVSHASEDALAKAPAPRKKPDTPNWVHIRYQAGGPLSPDSWLVALELVQHRLGTYTLQGSLLQVLDVSEHSCSSGRHTQVLLHAPVGATVHLFWTCGQDHLEEGNVAKVASLLFDEDRLVVSSFLDACQTYEIAIHPPERGDA